MFQVAPWHRPIQVVNLNPAWKKSRSFLGQETAVGNRLLQAQVRSILDRHALLIVADGMLPTDPAATRELLSRRFRSVRRHSLEGQAIEAIHGWSDDDLSALLSTASGPTEEESADLALIDGFFGAEYRRWRKEDEGPALLKRLACGDPEIWRGQDPEEIERLQKNLRWQSGTFAGDPFFCLSPVEMPRIQTAIMRRPSEFLGFSNDQAWGDVRTAVQNAFLVTQVLETYPFPAPLPAIPGVWYVHVRGLLNEFIRQEVPLDEAIVRMWITFATLESYDAVATEVVRRLEKEEKADKRKKIIRALGLTATFAVITAGLGAAFVGGAKIAASLTGLLDKVLSVRERKEAARDLEKAAKVFEESDAGFAQEVRQAEETLDRLAGEEERARGLSEEESQARAERDWTPDEVGVQDLDPLDPSGLPVVTEDLLLIGGIGLGAVLLIALLR